jgi:Ni/Fe-hydrogenase 1 B-type cytochrome subunit
LTHINVVKPRLASLWAACHSGQGSVMTEYKEYIAWDATTRWFHWINALAVISLIVTGLVVLFDNELGLSAAGKITLKSIHVSFGYVMALNLLWRFCLGILLAMA